MAVGLVCIHYSLRLNVESTVHGQQRRPLAQFVIQTVPKVFSPAAKGGHFNSKSCFYLQTWTSLMLSGPWKVKYVPHSDIGGEGYICLCTQIIFYHFKPLCINDINYNYATAAFLSALCPLSLFTSWHLQQEACINQIYKYTNRMMSIIHLSVVLIFLLSGACLGCISRVTVDFSTLNKMFTENFFENKILNHSLVALTWGFFYVCVCCSLTSLEHGKVTILIWPRKQVLIFTDYWSSTHS